MLRMRNLSDMNDLYNVQDVILLFEIMENRFQLMQDKYHFNPRKCIIYTINIYNEISPPITEKQKILDANERSVYQLVELYSETDKGVPRAYRPTAKAHARLFSKKFQPLHLEHLKILIDRAGWKVTKIYARYTFEQERFKKDFILMNQRFRQIAKKDVEKFFYKLLNNSNFRFDCRNNLDNYTFVPIFDELNEVTYLKKY